jgi:hypothetical protein
MPTLFFIVGTDSGPVLGVEHSFTHDAVGMFETVEGEVSGHTVAIVVCMIYPFGFFARVDTDQDGISRADSIAECPQEWGDLMSPEVSQTRA